MDIMINLLVFLAVFALTAGFSRKGGEWTPERLRKALCFFTCQSNLLCAVSCLLTAVFSISGNVPEWVWLLKYTGTAAVTVTMLTVFLFLAPSVGQDWVKKLLTGSAADLFMHLLVPVAALVSFCVFEKRGMGFLQALAGMLPVLLYGILYIRKTQFSPESKRWEDFYGFNRNGKMAVSAAGMLAGTFLVCMALMALQNR